MATAVKPPATVTVGPLDVKVDVNAKRANDASLTFGHYDRVYGEIVLAPNQGPAPLRDTLLHELLHACCDLAAMQAGGGDAVFEDDDHEERCVRALTPWLLDALRRNPDLVTYLLAQ